MKIQKLQKRKVFLTILITFGKWSLDKTSVVKKSLTTTWLQRLQNEKFLKLFFNTFLISYFWYYCDNHIWIHYSAFWFQVSIPPTLEPITFFEYKTISYQNFEKNINSYWYKYITDGNYIAFFYSGKKLCSTNNTFLFQTQRFAKTLT